jgi:hypothetical protein
MYIKDIIESRSVVEAPMNPSAFANAIEQGQGAGVLIGFEFEVHVPPAVFQKTSDDATITAKQADDAMYYANVWDNNVGSTFENGVVLSTKWFDSLFKFKRPYRGFRTANEAYQVWYSGHLPKIIELYNKLPDDVKEKCAKKALKLMRDSKPDFSFDSTSLQDQMRFARLFGRYVYADYNKSKIFAVGSEIVRTVDDSSSWNGFLSWLTGASMGIDRHTSRFFQYSPSAVWAELNLKDYADDDYDDDDDRLYRKAADALKPIIQSVMGRKVTVFDSYHQEDKNLKNWYIEPDGSLTADKDEDASAEIVSPPLPVAEAIDAVKNFYALAQQQGLYTNKTTGLHINVSIPQKLDLLKLAVFLGDQYVLKYFGREHNDYARSAQGHLVKNAVNKDTDLKMLQSIANNATGSHTSSISNNGKYISFRHAGGNYLQDFQGVYNVIGRFVRAMIIASDPAAYRQEYQSKLAKLMQGPDTDQIQKNTAIERVLDFVRTKGAPMITASVYTGRSDVDKVAKAGLENNGIKLTASSIQAGDAQAKTRIVSRVQNQEFRAKLDGQNVNKFYTMTFVPDSVKSLGAMAQAQFGPGVNKIVKFGSWEDKTLGYWHVEKTMLPPTDPRVQNLIKVLLRKQYTKK